MEITAFSFKLRANSPEGRKAISYQSSTPARSAPRLAARLGLLILLALLPSFTAIAQDTKPAVAPEKLNGDPNQPRPSIPGKIAFLQEPAPMNLTLTAFNGRPEVRSLYRHDRIYQECDAQGPTGVGRRLFILDEPNDPHCQPRLLVDAGKGWIGGAMCCSFDGNTIFFSMAPEGDSYYHIYRVAVAGGEPAAVLSGPFHDFDPELLPDGRIVFASSRSGTREEYHGMTGSGLFTMTQDGTDIRQITFNLAHDREPKVTEQGSVVFVRQDLMYDAAKIETQIFQTRPDGTGGQVLMGPDKGKAIYNRHTFDQGALVGLGLIPAAGREGFKRMDTAYGCPAPLPGGKVASLAAPWRGEGYPDYPFDPGAYGVAVSGTGTGGRPVSPSIYIADISPLPDGRLLCSARNRTWLGVMDPDSGEVRPFYRSDKIEIQAATYIGPRRLPKNMPSLVREGDSPDASGIFYCQNVRISKQGGADWKRIKAIRVIHGKSFQIRAHTSHDLTTHMGAEGHYLGTVPINPDGSFAVDIPADRSVSFLAVDAEGRAVINDLTWSHIRPGQIQSCVGCHNPRNATPTTRNAGRAQINPVKMEISARTYRYNTTNGVLNNGMLSGNFDRVKETNAINTHDMPPPASASQETIERTGGHSGTARWLCEIFPSSSVADKKAILERLRALHSPLWLPTVMAGLSDNDRGVRVAAGIAAAACGTREIIEPLLKAVGDDYPPARYAAHLALEHLTGGGVFSQEVLEDDGKLRTAWRQWFDKTNWEEIETAAIRQLQSSDPQDAIMAAQRLGHIGGSSSQAALLLFFQKQSESDKTDLLSIMEAAKSLGHLRTESALDSLHAVLSRCLDHIAKSNKVFQFREPIFYESKPTALDIALKRHGFSLPEPFDDGCKKFSESTPRTGWSIDEMDSRAVQLAAACVQAIGLVGGQKAISCLQDALAKAKNQDVYVLVLEQQGDYRAYTSTSNFYFRLMEALDELRVKLPEELAFKLLLALPWKSDRGSLFELDSQENMVARIVHRSGHTRKIADTCFYLLGLKGIEPHAPFLKRFLITTHNILSSQLKGEGKSFHEPYRAAQFARILAKDKNDAARFKEAFQLHLSEYKKNPRQRCGHAGFVCFYSLNALGDIDAIGSAELFRSVLEMEPSEAEMGMAKPVSTVTFTGLGPYFRAAAAHGLARAGDRGSVPMLLKIISDFRNAREVRYTAACALRTLCGPEHLNELKAIAENYPETTTRWELMTALKTLRAQQGDKQ